MVEQTKDNTMEPEEYMNLLYVIDDYTDEEDVKVLLEIKESVKYVKIY